MKLGNAANSAPLPRKIDTELGTFRILNFFLWCPPRNSRTLIPMVCTTPWTLLLSWIFSLAWCECSGLCPACIVLTYRSDLLQLSAVCSADESLSLTTAGSTHWIVSTLLRDTHEFSLFINGALSWSGHSWSAYTSTSACSVPRNLSFCLLDPSSPFLLLIGEFGFYSAFAGLFFSFTFCPES